MTRKSRARHAVVAAVTERLPYKAAAIFFALVLWLVVSGEERTEAVVAVRFAPRVDSSLGRLEEPPRIRALVEGRGRDILKLYAQPPVLRPTITAREREFEIDLAVRDLRLPEDVNVVVREIRPRRATLRFAPRAVAASASPDTVPPASPLPDSLVRPDTSRDGVP